MQYVPNSLLSNKVLTKKAITWCIGYIYTERGQNHWC